MAGFFWSFNISGGAPRYETFVVKASAVLSEGEFLNLESGEADAGATNDAAFIGPACSDVDNTADGETVRAIVNPDAVYEVYDANARTVGDLLDLASGGMGVTTNSNGDFMVWRSCTASEPTLVVVTPGNGWLD